LWQSGPTETAKIGFANRDGQTNRGTRSLRGTVHGQLPEKLQCNRSGEEYGANGTDRFQHKRPS
jgi:hypothetical protein